jgi:DUF1365 family protein
MEVSTPKLFSFNRWNILSMRTKDHGAKDKNISWYKFITSELDKAKIPFKKDYTIDLIAHPRLLGYAFNPISYWLIRDADKNLRAVMCEVRNTFKQSHNYLLAHKDNSVIIKNDVISSKKNLFVSPFNKVEGYYEFTFTYGDYEFKSVINYFDETRQILNTYVGGRLSNMTSKSILKAVSSYPFMTIGVVAKIHWQAVKLYVKKVKQTLKFRPKKYKNNDTTISKK